MFQRVSVSQTMYCLLNVELIWKLTDNGKFNGYIPAGRRM